MLKISIAVLLVLLSHMLFSQERPKTPSTPTTNIADACSLNFEKLKSAFVQDPAQYKSFNQPEKNNWNRTLKQGVVMKNGTEVRMIKSGCTHYIFLINFRPTEIKGQKAEYLYELATEQLKLMPVEKDEEFNVTLMTNALDKRNWPKIRFENDIYYLPCNGALCTLRVIRENGLPRDLELIYDKTL